MRSRRWNIGIGLFFAIVGALVLFVWIPADVETGVIAKERRDIVIGDAMAPSMAAAGILVFSLALVAAALFGPPPSEADDAEYATGLSGDNLRSVIWLSLIVLTSLASMTWAGTVVVQALQALGAGLPDYRLLRDTVPYKYIGFTVGGFLLVCGLIAWIEGRVRRRAVYTAIAAVAVLILLYDLPFDSLLLPPNGDG